MSRPMKQMRYDPCSFRPHIKVSETFVKVMIDEYLYYIQESPEALTRTNFLTWYIEMVVDYGVKNINCVYTERASKLYESWFRNMQVAKFKRNKK